MIWDQEKQLATWEPGDYVELVGPQNQVLDVGTVQRTTNAPDAVLVKDTHGEMTFWPYKATRLRD